MLRSVLRVLVAAETVGACWLVGILLAWCVDGATDELRSDNATWGYAVFLVGLGLVPVGAGLCAWLVARKAIEWSRWTAWAVAVAVGGGVSVPVLIVRAFLPPGG